MKWLIALLPGGLVLLAAWHLLQLTSCKHVDEFGVSLLSWTWRDGRARGFCPDCQRWTHGWDVPAPKYDRAPCARLATPLEMQQLRWRRAARERTAERMRRSA